jgi:predicted RNA polymerase sigma factor
MAGQPFERLLDGDPPLLGEVEAIVVAAHHDRYEASGRTDWTEPKAYQWLHYEDPDPVRRLAAGVRRLEPELALQESAVDAAIAHGQRLGRK